MSEEQHEPSYYEIALTGKQVTGAFVVVLVSLLVAFFAGVWIGRGAPREVTAAAAETAAPPVTAPSNELSFFSDRPAEGRPGARPETKPQPAAVVPPAPEPEPEPEPVAELPKPVVEPAPAAVPRPETNPEPAKPEPAKPEPAKPEPVKPEPVKPDSAKAPPPSPTGPLVIQVFTSSDEGKAKDMLKKLKASQFKAYLSPTKANGRTVYRVRVGPFQKEADAKTTSEKIEKQFKLETWITRTP